MSLRNIARKRQQQAHRVLCGGYHIGLRSVTNQNSSSSGGACVDIIQTDSSSTDDLQLIRDLQKLSVNLSRRANNQCINFGNIRTQICSGQI